MKDETYAFIQDVKQRGDIARSARNTRTHNGKGGRVKFSSDYKTRKELNAMNGECKSYRLNEPMKWNEFKAMPDDIKVTYIKMLQQKYNVPCTKLGEMFGVERLTVSKMLKKLNIEVRSRGRNVYDKEGWLAFVHGTPVAKPVEEAEIETAEEVAAPVEVVDAPVSEDCFDYEQEYHRLLKENEELKREVLRLQTIKQTVEVIFGGVIGNGDCKLP